MYHIKHTRGSFPANVPEIIYKIKDLSFYSIRPCEIGNSYVCTFYFACRLENGR